MGGAPDTPAGVYAWGGLKAGSEARAAEGDRAAMLACSTTQVVLALTLALALTRTLTLARHTPEYYCVEYNLCIDLPAHLRPARAAAGSAPGTAAGEAPRP